MNWIKDDQSIPRILGNTVSFGLPHGKPPMIDFQIHSSSSLNQLVPFLEASKQRIKTSCALHSNMASKMGPQPSLPWWCPSADRTWSVRVWSGRVDSEVGISYIFVDTLSTFVQNLRMYHVVLRVRTLHDMYQISERLAESSPSRSWEIFAEVWQRFVPTMLRHGFQTSSASATVPTAPGGLNPRICRGDEAMSCDRHQLKRLMVIVRCW